MQNIYRITGAVFLAGMVSIANGVLALESDNDRRLATGLPTTLTEFSPTRNVLHVVLDQMGLDLFMLAVEGDKNIREALDGFTVFTDTLSVYPSTQMSIVTLLTGEVFRNNESKKAFVKRVKQKAVGVELLKRQGFELDSHTLCGLGVLQRCSLSNKRIISRDVADIEAMQLLDIFIFRAAPDYVKPKIYNNEKWLFLDISNRNKYLKSHSGVAHIIFEKFIDEIAVAESSSPRYKFFHSQITHAPADMDAECNILMEDQVRSLSTPGLIQCGLGHFIRLLHKLEQLGVYDNTMIVLSSDHGDYRADKSVNIRAFNRLGFETNMVTRSFASLAIKPVKARGPVAFTSAPVSLRDIPHTILAAHNIKPGPEASPGTRDVFSVSETENREREYLFYAWKHEYWMKDFLPPITLIRVNGPMKDPASWREVRPAVREAEAH